MLHKVNTNRDVKAVGKLFIATIFVTAFLWGIILFTVRWKQSHWQKGLDVQLAHAIEHGDHLAVQQLLSSGANPNALYCDDRQQKTWYQRFLSSSHDPDSDNCSETMLSLAFGDDEITLLLLNNGAQLEKEFAAELLQYAGLTDSAPIVSALLKRGYSPDLREGEEMTALMYATHRGHQTMVKSLLLQGANVNLTTSKGTTALMFAARFGSEEAVASLLRYKADPNLTDKKGRCAIDYCSNSTLSMRKLLSPVKRR